MKSVSFKNLVVLIVVYFFYLLFWLPCTGE